MGQPDKASQPDKSLLNLLEHGKFDAAEHLKGVDLHIDDPLVRNEEFIGTDGVTDVFVFNAGVIATNVTSLRNFDLGEDYFLFQNMEGRELVIGDLGVWDSGQPIGFNFVLFHSTPDNKGANILVWDVPYQQDIEQMVLPFDGYIKFDDPFLV
jgi:hypothetical protein